MQCVLIFGTGLLNNAEAADTARWSVTPILGIHMPQLEALNKGEFRSPIVGVGVDRPEPIAGQTPGPETDTGEATSVAFGGHNDLPEIGAASNAGLEFQWIQSDKHSVIFGASSWEGFTEGGRVPMRVPLQGDLRDAVFERRASLSYNEFFFGWRYNAFIHPKKKYSLYTRLTFNELFDIDFRESLIYSFADTRVKDRPELDFIDIKRIFILDSQATGVILLQFGAGGEYFLNKRVSIGFESSYVFQPRSFALRPSFIDEDTQDGDGMTVFYPALPDVHNNNDLRYVQEDVTPSTAFSQNNQPPTNEMKLSFQGWKAALKLNVYF